MGLTSWASLASSMVLKMWETGPLACLPADLLKMQILDPYPRLPAAETLGGGPSCLIVSGPDQSPSSRVFA